MGGPASGGQTGGGRILRPGRLGKAATQSATRGDDGSVIWNHS